MGWVYFNKHSIRKGKASNEQLQKQIDEEINKTEIPEIEFCQVETELEEFMKSIIQD